METRHLPQTTKVFMNGRSQAVRIPKEFRFNTDRVIVTRVGHALVLTPEDQLAAVMREGFRSVPEDFMASGREEIIPSERDSVDVRYE